MIFIDAHPYQCYHHPVSSPLIRSIFFHPSASMIVNSSSPSSPSSSYSYSYSFPSDDHHHESSMSADELLNDDSVASIASMLGVSIDADHNMITEEQQRPSTATTTPLSTATTTTPSITTPSATSSSSGVLLSSLVNTPSSLSPLLFDSRGSMLMDIMIRRRRLLLGSQHESVVPIVVVSLIWETLRLVQSGWVGVDDGIDVLIAHLTKMVGDKVDVCPRLSTSEFRSLLTGIITLNDGEGELPDHHMISDVCRAVHLRIEGFTSRQNEANSFVTTGFAALETASGITGEQASIIAFVCERDITWFIDINTNAPNVKTTGCEDGSTRSTIRVFVESPLSFIPLFDNERVTKEEFEGIGNYQLYD